MLKDDIEQSAANLGHNLAAWRKLLGLRAEQVAERANISRTTYSKIENGNAGVNLGNVLAALRALGLLEKTIAVTDPYEHDLGRIRADEILPKRIRR